jgi:hypothetical protein
VRFIHDDRIPWARERRCMYIAPLQVFGRRNDPIEVRPRLQTLGERRLSPIKRCRIFDRLEFETEFVPHFVKPLRDQSRRHNKQDPLTDSTCDQLEKANARLNSFSETHVVGDEETPAWSAKEPRERRELIGLR